MFACKLISSTELPCQRVYLEVAHAAGAGWGGAGGFGGFGGSDLAVRYSVYWGV